MFPQMYFGDMGMISVNLERSWHAEIGSWMVIETNLWNSTWEWNAMQN